MLDAVQTRAIRLIGDLTLTYHLQPLSHRRAVGDLSLSYRYSNGFCSFELLSIIPPITEPARCTRGTSHPKEAVLHASRIERHERLGPGMDCLVRYLLSLRVLVYSSLNFP
nr:unnamed protein product [Callosobruchus chinensis]